MFVAMPQLRSVTCQLSIPCDPFAWPAALTEINLRIPEVCKPAPLLDDMHLLLKSISTSARALKRFILHARLPTMRGLNFSFLLDLPELASLSLDFQRRRGYALWWLGDSQVHSLRQLTQLTNLEFPRLEPSSLLRLLRPPHQLSLARVPDFVPVDAQAAECLGSLPTLVGVNARLCSSVAFLAKLSMLTTLLLDCQVKEDEWLLAADDVLQGLSRCKGLTDLTLTAPLQSAHLIALLPRLPVLSRLNLTRMHRMDSLRCFSTGL